MKTSKFFIQSQHLVNLDFNTCTDGTRFGFVPLQSALDYGKDMNIPINHNILNENINTKLSRTPFDVIIGYPDVKNYYHLYYRDDKIYNVTHQPAVNCTNPYDDNSKYVFYEPDQDYSCGNYRGILTIEIGDEELYLENWKLNRKASFQAQYDLHINERNPFYQYPSLLNSSLKVEGIYSKDNNFEIIGNGNAKFYSDYINSPTGIGLSYNNPQSPVYWSSITQQQSTCWDILFGRPPLRENKKNYNIIKSNYMGVYPNPNDGTNFTIGVNSELEGQSIIEIHDMTGNKVYSQIFNETTNHGLFYIQTKKLSSGVYIIKFINKVYNDVQRVIIK